MDPSTIKIKQEKLTPEREPHPKSNLDKLLELKLYQESSSEDKKDIDKSATKSSNELLLELFGVFNAVPPELLLDDELLGDDIKKKKKKSKDKKREKAEKKAVKAEKKANKKKNQLASAGSVDEPKSKRVKIEFDDESIAKKIKVEKPDRHDFQRSREDSRKSRHKSRSRDRRTIKQEKEDKPRSRDESSKSLEKPRVSESKKSTSKIIIKDLKSSTILKSTTTTTSSRIKRDKERDERKDKNILEKPSGNISEVSLSDEETYQKHLALYDEHKYYEDKSRDVDLRRNDRSRDVRSRDNGREADRRAHVREWDRGKVPLDRREDSRRRDTPRSQRRSRSQTREPIDKKRLLEIARKNAITMIKKGALPRSMTESTREKLMEKIKHGGKSIDELTDYCRKLSTAEDLGELSSLSEDSDHDRDGKERAFHHPFELKDRGPIIMNIRNSVPIAPKASGQLKAIMSQFPVSSGKQHLAIESEWVPVTTSITAPTKVTSTTTVAVIPKPAPITLEKQIQEQLPELVPKPSIILPLSEPPKPPDVLLGRPYDWKTDDHYKSMTVPPPPIPTPYLEASNDPDIDVTRIISQRLNAIRKLQDNPNDCEATKLFDDTEKNMSAWATSKYIPGQFLGSTEVKVLSAKELGSGFQAWARKNQLIDAQPVNSGMGMALLQKMGWKPGEGLGKESNGSLQPLLLELKLDKKGLESHEDQPRPPNNPGRGGKAANRGRGGGTAGAAPMSRMTLDAKHPVSLLGELASKRRWGVPNYEVVQETGPAHARTFVFKVRLNGMEYTCPQGSNNKKEAKSCVAKFCLQQLGILPS